jgi:acylphosphatase
VDENADLKAVLVRIEGRVQGVWYRGWTLDQAVKRGLFGWVRNRTDGSVEALFAGPRAVVDDMVAACWQGPPSARVIRVSERPADIPQNEVFQPLPTA